MHHKPMSGPDLGRAGRRKDGFSGARGVSGWHRQALAWRWSCGHPIIAATFFGGTQGDRRSRALRWLIRVHRRSLWIDPSRWIPGGKRSSSADLRRWGPESNHRDTKTHRGCTRRVGSQPTRSGVQSETVNAQDSAWPRNPSTIPIMRLIPLSRSGRILLMCGCIIQTLRALSPSSGSRLEGTHPCQYGLSGGCCPRNRHVR